MPSIDHLLNQSNQVARATRVADAQGGHFARFAIVSDAVPMRIRPASAGERQLADREEAAVTHVIYTRTDSGIVRGDKVGESASVITGTATKADADTMTLTTGAIADVLIGDWFYFDADGALDAGVVKSIVVGGPTIDLEQAYAGAATTGAYTIIRHARVYEVIFPRNPSPLDHHLEIDVREIARGV